MLPQGKKKIPPCLYFLEKKAITAEIQPPFHSAFQILHKCIWLAQPNKFQNLSCKRVQVKKKKKNRNFFLLSNFCRLGKFTEENLNGYWAPIHHKCRRPFLWVFNIHTYLLSIFKLPNNNIIVPVPRKKKKKNKCTHLPSKGNTQSSISLCIYLWVIFIPSLVQ